MVAQRAHLTTVPTKSASRVMVTGGSGFIGTNILQGCLARGHHVLNIDIVPPRNIAHASYFSECDILSASTLNHVVKDFRPHYIFHMAARADLQGRSVDKYNANTVGVENLIGAISGVRNLRGIVFASTMLVCELGYQPLDDEDYCPTSFYGESKVIGEKIVRSSAIDVPWCIVRPTSIWGPWFAAPYLSFFKAVERAIYFHPRNVEVLRSYGYIENIVGQMVGIMDCLDSGELSGKTYYVTDREPVDIRKWADLISREFGLGPVPTLPLNVLRALACTGDSLRFLGWRNPPLSTRRLHNLMTSAVISPEWISPVGLEKPVDVTEAVRATIEWMRLLGEASR